MTLRQLVCCGLLTSLFLVQSPAVAEQEQAEAPSPSAEDREIIALLELLEMLEMLKDMEVLAVLQEEKGK